MISLFLLIAALATGNGITILCVVSFLAFVWSLIISAIKSNNDCKKKYESNPIDRHMDENYADIDWLRKGKM